jgi:hypothetical protein
MILSVAWQSEMAMLLLVVHVTEFCDGDDVEAIRTRDESRPRRALKRREILNPSHVSKRRKGSQSAGKARSPCHE